MKNGGNLTEYLHKRNLGKTPEPGARRRKTLRENRFVIQEHHASHLHWDFRIECGGVLVSWALPKGIPRDPKQNHLAVHTEDHPLEYLTFAGTIPDGQYGAGEVTVWDHGTYELHEFTPRKIVLTLNGEQTQGKYALFQTRGKNWMIHRMDPPSDARREPIPETIAPMMARLDRLPEDDAAYGYEVKWDGIRAIAFVEGGRVRLQSRNLLDITSQYPELKALGEQLGAREVVLDGEIIVVGEDSRPSFERLQQRMHVASEAAARRRMMATPVTYMIFDLLYQDGQVLMGSPYRERRRRLEALRLIGTHWQTPAYTAGHGAALLKATAEQRFEGIVAKRLDSLYEPGRRSGAWRKIKHHLQQEFVIGGWLPGQGARAGTLGALLLGYYIRADGGRKLHFAGKAGTGFTDRMLDELTRLLAPLRRKTTPFEIASPRYKQAVFVEPRTVAEFEFTEWTRQGALRHPSFKHLRLGDRDPETVVREDLPDTFPEGT